VTREGNHFLQRKYGCLPYKPRGFLLYLAAEKEGEKIGAGRVLKLEAWIAHTDLREKGSVKLRERTVPPLGLRAALPSYRRYAKDRKNNQLLNVGGCSLNNLGLFLQVSNQG